MAEVHPSGDQDIMDLLTEIVSTLKDLRSCTKDLHGFQKTHQQGGCKHSSTAGLRGDQDEPGANHSVEDVDSHEKLTATEGRIHELDPATAPGTRPVDDAVLPSTQSEHKESPRPTPDNASSMVSLLYHEMQEAPV